MPGRPATQVTSPPAPVAAMMGACATPIAMSPVTAGFTAVLDGVLRKPIESLDLAQIQSGRGQVYPDRPPFTWITGRVDRSVGITFGTAPARDGYDIPLRIYRPRAVRDTETDVPVIVYLHGGGWVQGNVVSYDPLCTHLARQVRAVVVSVDYRKAPEHKAPRRHTTGWTQRAGSRRTVHCALTAAAWPCAATAQAATWPPSSPRRHATTAVPASATRS